MRAAAAVLCATAVMLAGTASAWAGDWYADDNGSGVACTQANPCKSIVQAAAYAANGDTVHIAHGSYHESIATNKRITFEGGGSNPFAGGTFVQGTTAGPVFKLLNGGAIRHMAILATNTSSKSEAEDAISLGVTGSGAALAYYVDDVYAGAGNVSANNDPGHALIATDSASRPLYVQVSDSSLNGRNGPGDAVAFGESNQNSTYDLARVNVDAGSSHTGISMTQGSLTMTGGSIAHAGTTGLFVWFSRVSVDHASISAAKLGVLAFTYVTLTIRDSLVRADSPTSTGTAGVQLYGQGGPPVNVRLLQSTVVARGPSPAGALSVPAQNGDEIVHARSTAFRAIPTDNSTPDDVHVDPGGASVVFDMSHSYYGTAGGQGTGIPAPGSGTNVAGDPGFTDPAGGDFTLKPGSQLVDRGDPAIPLPGELDLAGAPRSRDGNGDCLAVPDIGAFERPALTPCKKPGGGPGGSGGGSPRTTPRITRVRFKPHRLRAGHRGRLSLRLSENAKLTVLVQRRKGKRFRRFATIVRKSAGPGPLKLRIGPKVKGKRLRRGRYRLRLRALDAAGNRSRTRRIGFIVVRSRGHR
jgi:hypothetical protein